MDLPSFTCYVDLIAISSLYLNAFGTSDNKYYKDDSRCGMSDVAFALLNQSANFLVLPSDEEIASTAIIVTVSGSGGGWPGGWANGNENELANLQQIVETRCHPTR